MCISIDKFSPFSFFYRRYNPYQTTANGKPMVTVFIDSQRMLSCQWCFKSSCFASKTCNESQCLKACLYANSQAFQAVLEVNGKEPEPEISLHTITAMFPNANIKDIQKFWKFLSKKQVFRLNHFDENKYNKKKYNLAAETEQAIEFLRKAEKNWHVAGVQVKEFRIAGFKNIIQRNPESGHIEICQQNWDEGHLILAAKHLVKKSYVVR